MNFNIYVESSIESSSIGSSEKDNQCMRSFFYHALKKNQFSLPLRAYSPYETTFHFRDGFFNKIEKGHLAVLYLYNVLYLFQLRKIEHRLGEVHSSPLYLNETGNPNVRNYSSLMENQNLNEFPSGVSFIQ
jgi:hypothetical protein